MRAGRYVRQPQRCRAFAPALSPPERPVRLEGERTVFLGAGGYDRITTILHPCEGERRELVCNRLGGWMLGHLFGQPVISVRAAEQYLGCSFATVGSTIDPWGDGGAAAEVDGAGAQPAVPVRALPLA
ncbi:MAG TPA: hypothetical protein VE057_26315, partial [Archangium sp.]|nr:hypothetical protein [Archangium sp.]